MVLSMFVVVNLAAAVLGVCRKQAWAAPLLPYLAPYEQGLGISQRWGMFAPHPPHHSIWAEAFGVDSTGVSRRLETTWDDLDGDGIRARYDGRLLLDRNIIAAAKGRLGKGYVDWLCAREEAAGRPVAAVRIERVSQRSRSPRAAREGRDPPEPTREVSVRRRCP